MQLWKRNQPLKIIKCQAPSELRMPGTFFELIGGWKVFTNTPETDVQAPLSRQPIVSSVPTEITLFLL